MQRRKPKLTKSRHEEAVRKAVNKYRQDIEQGEGEAVERDKSFPLRINPETFFRGLGARYKRIRLTPKGKKLAAVL